MVTGGTGLVGGALVRELVARNYKVIVLTRQKGLKGAGNTSYAYWNVNDLEIEERAIATADYIIHLAGTNIGEKRWTKERKELIAQSRVKSAELLCDALKKIPNKVKAVISASAIGWYGSDPGILNPYPFKEEAPPAKDYLGTTCFQWEQAIQPVVGGGRRLVILRTGIVLDRQGGILKELSKPLLAGLATVLGSGRQILSWIYLKDLVQAYVWAIENPQSAGVYNMVAPHPVSNRELVTGWARQLRGKFYLVVQVPAFLLKVVLGEMSGEVLKSATISCEKLLAAGFVFSCPTIAQALQEAGKKAPG